MNLRSDDIICGHSAMTVRDVLTTFCNGAGASRNSSFFAHIGLSLVDIHNLILDLFEEGYLEEPTKETSFFSPVKFDDGFPYYFEATDKGRRVACTRFTKRMKRKTIDNLLKTVLERAKKTAELDLLTFEVSKIWVFGSYLDKTAKDFGDLDLVIEARKKSTIFGFDKPGEMFSHSNLDSREFTSQITKRYREWDRRYEAGEIDCRTPQITDYISHLMWDDKAFSYYLKRGNSKISMHSMSEFETLKTKDIELVYDADAQEQTSKESS